MATISLALAQARWRKHLTQQQLARRMGVSRGLVGRIETGERELTPEVASAAIRATGDQQLAATYCACCPVGAACRRLWGQEDGRAA